MKNSLKVFTLSLLIIMMALFLTSCIDVKLDYELNDKSLVVLYTLSIDSTDCKWQQDETQLKKLLKSLVDYWDDQGFIISIDSSKENTPVVVQSKKILPSKNRNESLSYLMYIFTDKDLSPFKEVKCSKDHFFIFDIIYFTASLDTRTLLDYDTLNNLPSDLSNQLRDIMDQSHLAISFTTNLKVKKSNANEVLQIDKINKKYVWYIDIPSNQIINFSFYLIDNTGIRLIISIIIIFFVVFLFVKLNIKLNQNQYIKDQS